MDGCGLIECQTSAGCAHRGPKGEMCWFGYHKDTGPDWYCFHCDKFVPHSETRSGADSQRHDENKGGCGRPVHPNKFDPSQAPKEWR